MNEAAETKFQKVKQIYAHIDHFNGRRQISPQSTKMGYFFQSDLDCIRQGLEKVIEKSIIDVRKPFFDAGAGDGRIIATTACVFGMHSYGLEFDEKVVEDGAGKFRMLREENIVDPAVSMILGQGDFTLDASYPPMGVRFEDMGTIFNFDNSYWDLARKIGNQSPQGTIFIFKRITRRVENFVRLKFITQIDLTQVADEGYSFCIYIKE